MFLNIHPTNSTKFWSPYSYQFISIQPNPVYSSTQIQQLHIQYLLYFIHLPLYLLQECLSGTSIYKKIENLLKSILI